MVNFLRMKDFKKTSAEGVASMLGIDVKQAQMIKDNLKDLLVMPASQETEEKKESHYEICM